MPMPNRPGMRGVSLIEVLVALLLLGTGALCAGRLQAATATGLSEAEQRFLASHLALDLLGRARAHRAPVTGGEPISTRCDADSECDAPLWSPVELERWQALLSGKQVQVDGVAVGGLVDPAFCIHADPVGVGWHLRLTLNWRGRIHLADRSRSAARCGAPSTPEHPRRTLTRQVFVAASAD